MPALGKDLSKIRSHLGYSIQDVQHYTKIPVSTLKSIENGSIFNHPEENQTYIRSFVRSYGRALKIDDDIMIKALDQNETGNYNHLLLQEYPELVPEKPEQPAQEDEAQPEFIEQERINNQSSDDASRMEMEQVEEESGKESEPEPESQKKEPAITEAAVPQKDVKSPKTDSGPSVKSVDWADVGRKFADEKKHTPVWVIGLIIIIIIAAFVGYFLYQNGFIDLGIITPQEQEQVTPESEATQSSLSLNLEDSLAETGGNRDVAAPEEPAVELDEVLELTVYAAYGGLGPVRVWSDIKPRMEPYWLEQGTAMHFEFRDTIRVRGSYSDLLLFKDGHLVGNAAQEFFQQEEDYIELTRSLFSTDSKWATTVEYELPEDVPPPDSIASRPSF